MDDREFEAERDPAAAASPRLRMGETPAALEGAEDLAALLIRIGQSDRDAFTQFYALTSSRVFGLIRRVLVDAVLSQDTTQEVYLQVWQSAPRFDPKAGSALSWLMTLSHRRAVDAVRSRQRATDREAHYGASTQQIDHDQVLDSVTDSMDAAAVTTCLDSLTEAQRESVRLAYYAGLTYRDVAARLSVGLPAIKSRIRDGLRRLRLCLEVD